MNINLLQIAIKHHQDGNSAQAEKIYQQLLELNPNDANVLHLYGILAGQQGDYEKALDLISHALEIEPNSSTFHNSMGNVLWYMNQAEQAIAHYEKSIELQPHAPVAHNNLGNIYRKQEQYEKAIEHYRKAVEQQPSFSEALGNLGLLYQQQNKLDQALTYYQQHLQYEPNNTDTLINIGGIYVKQGNLLEGIDYFHRALEVQPNLFEANYNLGATYLSMQKPDKALSHFMRCLYEKPDAETHYNVGVIYMYNDQHQQAIDHFHSALELRPDYFEAHVNLAMTYLKIENYDKATEHFQKALKLEPHNPEIEYILSAITEGKDKPTATPLNFVKQLFDQYAPHFDKHLLEYLHYQAHKLLFETVKDFLKDTLNDFAIIDLGCGTGLCGELFKPYAKKLIGVDISSKMIEAAQGKNIYDQLIEEDVTAALKDFSAIDLILAADVFGYIGDLKPLFQAAYKALRDQGYFAFTVEKSEQPGAFTLSKSTRFVHSKEYIHKLCKKEKFTILVEKEVDLRIQRNQPVKGVVYLLRR